MGHIVGRRTCASASTVLSAMIRLMQYPPAWGTPSLDPECTRAQAWLRFSRLREGIDFEVDAFEVPNAAWSQQLPLLEVAGRVTGDEELYTVMRSLGHDLDASLSVLQRAESTAFVALVQERLGMALLYAWWEDEQNYAAVVKPALAAALPLPLCYYVPFTLRRRAHSQLARRRGLEAKTVYARGEEALAALSARLGQAQFFHGEAPTGVDATAFAYLTAVLRAPLPNDELRAALRAKPNLVAYCERIERSFFGVADELQPPVSVGMAGPPRHFSLAEAAEAAETAQAAETANGSALKSTRTPKAQRFRKRSRNAVVGALAAAAAFVLANDMLDQDEGQED